MNKQSLLRSLLVGITLTGLVPVVACSDSGTPGGREVITVYKSPSCGCCTKWVSYLEDSGFEVKAINRQDLDTVKSEAGIPRRLASCHTATIDGYTIEGHVPASDIRRLLRERPDVAGLTVPGMPMGSPGMEGHRKENYKVLTFTRTGETSVFSQY